MIALCHPFGNKNVREALEAFNDAGMLDRFHTTVYWDSKWLINSLLPRSVRTELSRRSYPQVKRSQVLLNPTREAGRLLSRKLSLKLPASLFSLQAITAELDAATARYVDRSRPAAVYAYAGTALRTFKAARRQGSVTIYELPCGYWRSTQKLLQEEASIRPEYAGTIENYNYSAQFLDARDEELSLASNIVIPSGHVKRTLEVSPVSSREFHLIPYGTEQASSAIQKVERSVSKKLRVIFVGYLSQIKGIGYLLKAIDGMESAVEFTMIGGKVGHSPCIDAAVKRHRWIPNIPREQVLEEMAQSDVLVLPSLSEGFGLVIGEALSRGLPVIATTATGGPEIIRDGKDGFLVPIRSSEAIANKLEVLHRNRELLDAMSVSAFCRAHEFTWQRYRNLLVCALKRMLDR